MCWSDRIKSKFAGFNFSVLEASKRSGNTHYTEGECIAEWRFNIGGSGETHNQCVGSESGVCER